MSRRSQRPGFRSFALALLLLLLPALGLPAQAPYPSQGSEDLDYLHTASPGAHMDFRGDLTLPAGFLDEGSRAFTGRVYFKGVPLGRFREVETGDADTVVARRNMTPFARQYPSRSSARLELVALSLRSAKPINVRVGRRTQVWDVKLGLSPARPSTGTMDLVQTSAKGGTFKSELHVVPLLTFVRRGDGVERTLDVGKLTLSRASEEALTLRVSDAPWSVEAPRNGVAAQRGVNPAVRDGTAVVIIHGPHPVRAALLNQPGLGPQSTPGF